MVDIDQITAAEARSPDVGAALRARFSRNMRYSMAGIPPSVGAIVAVLWTQTAHLGLLTWAVLAMSSLALHWLLWVRHGSDTDWSRGAVWAQVFGGIVWGLLPWLMLPRDPVWQALCVSLIVSLMASSVGFSSALRWGPSAFIIPTAVLSSAGFWIRGGNELWGGALLIAATGLFTLGLAAMSWASDVEAAVLFVRTHKQATVDGLTGALNRREFLATLDSAVTESDDTVGIAYLDIDKFKEVNDSMGHAAGDDLLVEATGRINAMLGPTEVLGRIGGDELVVLSPQLTADRDLVDLGDRILECFTAPFRVHHTDVNVTCSVGVAGRQSGATGERLLADADAAMYRAKRSDDRRAEVAGTTRRDPVTIS